MEELLVLAAGARGLAVAALAFVTAEPEMPPVGMLELAGVGGIGLPVTGGERVLVVVEKVAANLVSACGAMADAS